MEKRLKTVKRSRAIGQCLLGVLFMSVVLFALGKVTPHDSAVWAIGAGSLASSTYLVFVTPQQPHSCFFQIVMSYLVCAVIGVTGNLILIDVANFFLKDIIAAFAVGLSLFTMSRLGLRHSCAAGISVMLALELHDQYPVIVILASVLLLSAIHASLKSKLQDLV
jgi:CBS-domain-containing membrane protein